MELTILMPCLDEEETVAVCIQKAKTFLEDNGIDGEILVSDNGSTDRSREIAVSEGAKVIVAEQKGYGNALIAGTKEAQGKYIIMGDADDSYDFLRLMPFLEKLREGYDLVMGDRFAGGIEQGAMPWSHRYIGNPFLSFVGRKLYHSNVRDFHCGLRGYNRESILNLNLQASGMEYASEMVVKAELGKLKITEVPVFLSRDGRSKASHLRSFRDGCRHMKLLLANVPKRLFQSLR
jgi:glycosyltransferase involved in cell wall biosynthesis